MVFARATRRTVLLAASSLGLLGVPVLATAAPAIAAPSDPPASASAVAPTPTPARAGKPSVVVAVGDSITQSTGTGELSKENPKNSWATGEDVNSVAKRLGVSTGNRYNLSKNGARMTDMVAELRDGKSGGSGDVAPMPASTGLVLVEFGGNDLCRDSVAAMTSVASYRTQFRAGLAQIKAQAPDALIQVMSVPDIYNLWYIRGGPQNATYHPEPASSQAAGYNGARFYWGMSFFPCQSLLANPDSYAAADRQRRLDVRERTKAYNQVLAEECGTVLRCRFDGNQLFSYTSNRATIDGPLLPQSQWNFTDNDISRNEGIGTTICPVQGVFAGGCGDHFHPTKQGQGKVADRAVAAGRNWADTTAPTVGIATTTAPRSNGTFTVSATVRFSGSDSGTGTTGLRGQEVRLHLPDGTITPWTATVGGVAPDRTVSALGTTYVEARSLDVNGNRSASKVLAVTVTPPVAPGAMAAPEATASPAALTLGWPPVADDGGDPAVTYDVTTYVDGAASPTGPTVSVAGGSRSTPATGPFAHVLRYRVAARTAAGTGDPSPASAPLVRPFASLGAFVDRQYADFALRAPTATERAEEVALLAGGLGTPAALVDRLRAGDAWHGVYASTIRLYRAYFLRLPDPSGLDHWVGRRRAGSTLSSISQRFAVSSEFLRTYGKLSDAAFVDTLYRNVFDRDPDPSGRAYYLGRLAAGWSRGRVVLQFSDSSEYTRDTEQLVTVVELARAMDGTAPSQALVDTLLAAWDADDALPGDGVAAVVAALTGTDGYRTRAIA